MNQLRDKQGRFVKETWAHKGNLIYDKPRERPILVIDEQPLKIPRLVRIAVWLSHNRFEVGYVLLCFLAGAVGGYLGARYGLHL